MSFFTIGNLKNTSTLLYYLSVKVGSIVSDYEKSILIAFSEKNANEISSAVEKDRYMPRRWFLS